MPALTDSPDYRKGYRERVCGAPIVTVQGSSQFAYVPLTALPRALQGQRLALVTLDAGDIDYQSEKARAVDVG